MKSLVVLLCVSLLVACGSDADKSGSGGATSEPGISATETAPDGDESGGAVDCAEVRSALTTMGIPLQLMAQVRDPSSIQTLKEPPVGPIDMDAFLAAIADLRVLEAYPSPLGYVKDSFDSYEQAGVALKGLLEEEAVTQADIDAYNAKIGPAGEFLAKQSAIAGAMGEAGC